MIQKIDIMTSTTAIPALIRAAQVFVCFNEIGHPREVMREGVKSSAYKRVEFFQDEVLLGNDF